MRHILQLLKSSALQKRFKIFFRQNRAAQHASDGLEQLLESTRETKGESALFTRSGAGPNVLLPRRLQLAGIDPNYVEAFEPEVFAHIRQVCGTCGDAQRCARDLATGDPLAVVQDYCPNTPEIDKLLLSK